MTFRCGLENSDKFNCITWQPLQLLSYHSVIRTCHSIWGKKKLRMRNCMALNYILPLIFPLHVSTSVIQHLHFLPIPLPLQRGGEAYQQRLSAVGGSHQSDRSEILWWIHQVLQDQAPELHGAHTTGGYTVSRMGCPQSRYVFPVCSCFFRSLWYLVKGWLLNPAVIHGIAWGFQDKGIAAVSKHPSWFFSGWTCCGYCWLMINDGKFFWQLDRWNSLDRFNMI